MQGLNVAWQCLIIDSDAEHAEELSEVLLQLGALSVDLLDADAGTPDEMALFGEPGEPTPSVWQHSRVSALFDESANVNEILELAASRVRLPQPPRHRIESLEDKDWVRLTQSQFEPIRVSDRLWIVPSWQRPRDEDAVNIILDPGLAFGTGSHPTTRLCLRWLDEHLRSGETVLDYGCGSGILAIAAIKLGAANAIGVDVDPQAVTASRSNAMQNEAQHAQFYLADDFCDLPASQLPPSGFDVVIANILTNPLRMLAPLLAHATKPGGQIVLSGVLETQADDVIGVYRQWCDMNPPCFEEGWSLLSGCRR
jgi:ribosomal protein L11 methyltransferase